MSELNKARQNIGDEVARIARLMENNFRVPRSNCGKPLTFSNRSPNWESEIKLALYEAFKNWRHIDCHNK